MGVRTRRTERSAADGHLESSTSECFRARSTRNSSLQTPDWRRRQHSRLHRDGHELRVYDVHDVSSLIF